MMGDVFLTVPRRFSSLFASAHVIGLRLGINQSATALDEVSAAPGKHMCRKSLVINLFFSQISGFYPFELRWVSKMFVHCIKPSSSIMYNLWKWSDGRGRKSCIDRRAQHGGHVPTLVGQCGTVLTNMWRIYEKYQLNTMYEDIREYSLTYDPLLSGVSLKWVLYFASESPESGSGQNGIIKF